MNIKDPDLIRKVFLAFLINLLVIVYLITRPISSKHTIEEANKNAAEIQLAVFKQCTTVYFRNHGSLPIKLSDMVTNPGNIVNWRQLLEEIPRDPWGNEYSYNVGDKIIEISSEGPTNSDDDDISVTMGKPQTIHPSTINQ